jgi:hypothetical protein
MKGRFFLFFLLAASLWSAGLQAQDSLSAPAGDTIRDSMVIRKKFQPDPKKAGLYSALVPGLGQLYNRQYWKVPVIYAGLGTATYFFIRNNNDYNRYRKAYVSRLNNPNARDEFSDILSTAAVKQYQDDAKKYLDITVLFTVIGYAGQVLEAIAGAHLHNFDISPDLSMQVRPVLMPNNTLGMGLVMNF